MLPMLCGGMYFRYLGFIRSCLGLLRIYVFCWRNWFGKHGLVVSRLFSVDCLEVAELSLG